MQIAHNLLSQFTQRQLNIETSSGKKSAEKLSSGYRINRSADDAAGLAISEKLRHQIRGLEQASRNIQDGISICQIADGGLHESMEILQRINELSIQAANDTNTPSDRKEIQREIAQLVLELDKIANTTEYNAHLYPLRDGHQINNPSTNPPVNPPTDPPTNPPITIPGPTTKPVNPVVPPLLESDYGGGTVQIIDSNTISNYSSYVDSIGKLHYVLGEGTFQIMQNAGSNIVYDISGTSYLENTDLKNVSIQCKGTNLSIKNVIIDNSANTKIKDNQIGAAIEFLESGNKLNCFETNKVCAGRDSYDVDPNEGGMYKSHVQKAGIQVPANADLEINGTESSILQAQGNEVNLTKESSSGYCPGIGGYDMNENCGNITINSGHIIAEPCPQNGFGVGIECDNLTVNGGLVDVYAGVADQAIYVREHMEVNGGAINAMSSLTERYTGPKCNIFTRWGTIDINGGFLYSCWNGNRYSGSAFGNNPYDGMGGASINIRGGNVVAVSKNGPGIYLNSNSSMTITGGNVISVSPDTLNAIELKATSILMADGELDDPKGFNDEKGHNIYIYPTSKRPTDPDKPTDPDNPFDPTGDTDGVFIQVSNLAFVTIRIPFVDATAKSLGVDKLDVSTREGANEAMTLARKALDIVTDFRTIFGTRQNKLEHAKAVADNTAENSQTAESRIRDTDMSKEIVEYARNQILSQVSQSMLTQANQIPQRVLALLQNS